jgi:para-aminobenzoate synthetase component 1
MLQTLSYSTISDKTRLNTSALNEAFSHVVILDSNLQSNASKYLKAGKIIALGCTREFCLNTTTNSLNTFQCFLNEKPNWLFGFLSYDLKNDIENLTSKNTDKLGFPEIHFFVPEVVIQIDESNVSVVYDDALTTKARAEEIHHLCFDEKHSTGKKNSTDIQIVSGITKNEYLNAIYKLKEHILKGDIYEINYCIEFFAENAVIDTVDTFEKLNNISHAPFSAFGKFNNNYILCSSPERFIKKSGNTLISQPIKGTQKRSFNQQEDEQLKIHLQQNDKEKSENIMIVDLVRNDLSRIAKQGSVKVDELLGLYTFKQVHQLISTIQCEVDASVSFTDIIRSTFPMGSMTGAPKVSAMKLIEEYEHDKRGVYSGAIGYIKPNGDFDFNVIIRSILYNAKTHTLSFMAGSAITAKSNAIEEYEECLLKAKAMFEVLEVQHISNNT